MCYLNLLESFTGILSKFVCELPKFTEMMWKQHEKSKAIKKIGTLLAMKNLYCWHIQSPENSDN